VLWTGKEQREEVEKANRTEHIREKESKNLKEGEQGDSTLGGAKKRNRELWDEKKETHLNLLFKVNQKGGLLGGIVKRGGDSGRKDEKTTLILGGKRWCKRLNEKQGLTQSTVESNGEKKREGRNKKGETGGA